MHHTYGWMGGWMGGGSWIWPLSGALVVALAIIVIMKVSRRGS
jgi:hypothetical protein